MKRNEAFVPMLYRERGSRFPGWVGPVAGTLLGAGFAIAHIATRDQPIEPWNAVKGIAIAAGIGFLAGCIVWLNDRLTPSD